MRRAIMHSHRAAHPQDGLRATADTPAAPFNPFAHFAYEAAIQSPKPTDEPVAYSRSTMGVGASNSTPNGNDDEGWIDTRDSKASEFERVRNVQKAILAQRRRESYQAHKEIQKERIKKRRKNQDVYEEEDDGEHAAVPVPAAPLPAVSAKSSLVRNSLLDRSLDDYDPLEELRAKQQKRRSVVDRLSNQLAARTQPTFSLLDKIGGKSMATVSAANDEDEVIKRKRRVLVFSDDEDDVPAPATHDVAPMSSIDLTVDGLEDTPSKLKPAKLKHAVASTMPFPSAKLKSKLKSKRKTVVDSESEEGDGEGDSDSSSAESEEELTHDRLMDKARTIIKQCEQVSAKLQRAILSWDKDASMDRDCINLTAMDAATGTQLLTNEDYTTICPGLSLNPYQVVGVNWLKLLYENDVNGALADDMGLGKTVQTIAFLSWLLHKEGNGTSSGASSSSQEHLPHLIVVPASTLNNWKNEVEKFNPDINLFIYHGSQAERAELRAELRAEIQGGNVDVILTTYTLFERDSNKQDRSFLAHQQFDYLVLDEAHCIKNSDSSRYTHLNSLDTRHRLLLSGTPVQNNLSELMALLSFLMPTVFAADKCQLLIQAFGWTNTKDKTTLAKAEASVSQLKSMLAPFVLRRLKVDVLDQLSTKQTSLAKMDMTPRQQAIYDNIISTYAQKAGSKGRSKASIDLFEVTREISRKVIDAQSPGAPVVVDLTETPVKPLGHAHHLPDHVDLREDEGDTKELRQNSARELDPVDAHAALQSLNATEAKHLFTALRKAANHPLLLRIYYQEERILQEIASVAHIQQYFGNQVTSDRVLSEIKTFSDFDLHQLCVMYPSYLAKYELSAETLYDSPKMVFLRENLPRMQSEGHRMLIFSQWTRILDLLEVLLEDMGMGYLRLDGSTAVRARQDLIDTFNADNAIPVFLLSTKAGGLGINLTAADTVILHDLDFNPENDKQAEDRCHRIGQTKPVTVYKLVANGTVDEDIYEMGERKSRMSKAVLSNAKAEPLDATTNGATGKLVDGDDGDVGDITAISRILSKALLKRAGATAVTN